MRNRSWRTGLVLVLGVAGLGACKRSEAPAGGGPASASAAESSVGVPGGGTAAAAISAGSWTIDPVHSAVLFKVAHMGVGYTWGQFREFAGRVVLDAADAAKNKVEITIQAGSVFSNSEQRDEHLRGPDFLNAVQFPTLSFASTAVARRADGGYDVAGNITIRGTSKPLQFVAWPVGEGDDPMGKRRAGFEASFTVDRLAFGVSYMPEGLGKDVTVVVSAEAVKD
jgi:polyisoprenoid-binding protein YceI